MSVVLDSKQREECIGFTKYIFLFFVGQDCLINADVIKGFYRSLKRRMRSNKI